MSLASAAVLNEQISVRNVDLATVFYNCDCYLFSILFFVSPFQQTIFAEITGTVMATS